MINAVNEQFSRFVSFAQERMTAGKGKAIATKGEVMAGGGTTLEERSVTVTDKIDWVSLSIFRGGNAKRANNEVRAMFMKSVADMFGGERNIPDSVREAMLLKDYGCGKPLTARRILAVKEAIENLNRGNAFDKANDPNGELANKAFAAGRARKAFPDHARGQQHVFRHGRLDARARRRLRARKAPAVHAGRRPRKQCDGSSRALHRDGAPLEPHDHGLPTLRRFAG